MCPHSRGCSRPCRARLPAGTPGTALGPRVKCCKWWVRGAGAAPGGVRDCAGCRAQPCLQDKPPSGVCGGLAPSRDGQSHPWCAPGPPDPAVPLVWRRACFAPCPKHTSSTPTAQGDVWRRGEKKNPSSSPWQARGQARGAAAAPGTGLAPCCPAHPTPRTPTRGTGGCWFWKAAAFTQRRALALCTLPLCAQRLGTATAPSSPRWSRGLKIPHTHTAPHPASSPHQAGSQQPPAQSFIEVFAQNKHQGHGAGCSTRQPAPGVPGGAGGAGLWGGLLSCSRSSPAGATAGPARGARTGSGAGWRPTRSSAGTRPSRRRAGGPGTPGTRSPPTCRTWGSAQWHCGVGKDPPPPPMPWLCCFYRAPDQEPGAFIQPQGRCPSPQTGG